MTCPREKRMGCELYIHQQLISHNVEIVRDEKKNSKQLCKKMVGLVKRVVIGLAEKKVQDRTKVDSNQIGL